MPTAIFFGLLSASLIGIAGSFFLSGIPFAVLLSMSSVFPAIAIFKGFTVLMKRKMIMSFVIDEIRSAASGTTKDLAYMHNKAVNVFTHRSVPGKPSKPSDSAV